MKKVLLDTNVLLLPGAQKIDIFEELAALLGSYEAIVPSFVKSELNGLAQGQGKAAESAKIALGLLGRATVVQVEKSGTVDNSIVQYAKANNLTVFTNDSALKKKLDEAEIQVIFFRKAFKKLSI